MNETIYLEREEPGHRLEKSLLGCGKNLSSRLLGEVWILRLRELLPSYSAKLLTTAKT
jgi:hypothetical protein